MGERVAWLREAMAGHVEPTSGPRYVDFRDAVVGPTRSPATSDTVVVSHFVAINAAIGAATGDDRLVHPPPRQLLGHRRRGRRPARCVLVEGGHEADTLIR